MENEDGAVSETKGRYDVFLSFRGEDTRQTFTCHLYDALCRKGIKTFMDDEELKRGDELAPKLLKAIQESRISVVVFSENYAGSSWCLDELVKIHDCKKSKNQVVYPIFYKVDPSVVRHQIASYGEAMTKHESRFGKDSEKVLKWRSALSDIANVKGDHLKVEQGTDESKFMNDLAREIFNKVSPKDLSKNEHIVGRKHLVEKLKSLLDLESRRITCLLGIHGIGGIGKTTLAKVLYDSIHKQFEASSFFSDVRDTSNRKGLEHLQQSLLKDILEDRQISLDSKEEGIRQIKSRFGSKRVLIVLDYVDNIEQMKNLVGVGDCFGDGSRIIITTRDKHLLDVGRVKKRYEVKELPYQECLELFCQSAFGKSCPEADYQVLSDHAVRCCRGLPLALKVLASHMNGKDESGWKDALKRYEKSPHEDVRKVLRISYDSLPFNEKNIFLDIACLFKSYHLEHVKRILDACDFSSGDGITTLVNKSLLTVDDNNCLKMHDLIQHMGRAIVKEETVNGVGEYSRLWNHEDAIEVLVDDKGSSKIQAIMLEPPFPGEDVDCIDTVFEKMKNLRILIVGRHIRFLHEPRYLPNNLRVLIWSHYPSQSLPSGFYPRKIGVFSLFGCSRLVLEKPFQRFAHLTHMEIGCCDMVTEFPDVSGAKKLRELRIEGCENLFSIHESVGHLANLVFLNASYCTQLQSFVPTIYVPCLQTHMLNGCSRLAHFPEIKGVMDKPLKIHMSGTAIKDLPESINKLVGLIYLELEDCMELQHLPSNLFMLPNFVTLIISGCSNLGESFRRFERSQSACPKLETLHFNHADLSDEELHMIIYDFPNLKELDVPWNEFVSVPAGIIESTKLAILDVSHCENLEELPKLPSSVQKLDATQCNSLTTETADLLWFQVLKGSKRLQVMWPKSEIPEWFDYVKEEGFPIFKARGKFPAVALVFVFDELPCNISSSEVWSNHMFRDLGVYLMVEGEHRGFLPFFEESNRTLLLDLEVLLSLEDAAVGLGNDWKTIHIYCKSKLAILSWGVYVHKLETNMNDIKFTTG